MRRFPSVVLAALAVFTLTSFRATSHHSCFILGGTPVWLSLEGAPQFTPDQLQHSSPATREGLVRWAATQQGRRFIRALDHHEFRVVVAEDANESGPGRAPQPPLATLVAFGDHNVVKSYSMILNPVFGTAKGFTLLPGQPATAGDIMATAWAAEMLHILYYSRGISLPHHSRADFQQEWRAVAAQLGFPSVKHEDDSGELARGQARVVYW